MTPTRGARGSSAVMLPTGYWPAAAVRAVLDSTLVTRLEPNLSALTSTERDTLRHLYAAGLILEDIFQDQFHHQALAARAELMVRHEALGLPARTRDLLELYELSQAPIATTLDNERVPFLPVDAELPGKNVYPLDAPRAEIEAFLDRNPDEREEILHPHTIVRRATRAALRRDLAVLRRHPALALLHPGLEGRWKTALAGPGRGAFYAVPYSIAWADQLLAAYRHVNDAANAIRSEDRDFADFLRLRARDLLANDYEGGDAAWVRGQFGRLNAVIGPYETYDDDLFGVKSFFGLRLLVRDQARSQSLIAALAHLQSIEDALPIDRHKVARTDIPIGVYEVAADFGQQRTGVAAQILPNPGAHVRKYGRSLMIAHNLITDPAYVARRRRRWQAAVAPAHRDDVTAEGAFEFIMWHEVGHYLGPETRADGRPFTDALEETTDLVEELKAELISSFAAPRLRNAGHFDEDRLRQIQASGIASGLRPVRPLRSQPYETLWLMETNFFLEHGVLEPNGGRLDIRYERVDQAVAAMLRDVLEIQSRGSRETAEAYIDRYTTWDDRHETIAAAVRAVEGHRFLAERNTGLGS